MKHLVFILTLLICEFAFCGGEPVASDALLKKALANPSQYYFDDGGNIDFGNGFYKRRFSSSGKALACYQGNYIFAGATQKCIQPTLNSDGDQVGCDSYIAVELKTVMVGIRKICSGNEENSNNNACAKYSTIKVSRGPRVKVAIFYKPQMNSKNSKAGLLGYNYLTLPRCHN
jgi:hypothetical protein